MAYKDILVYADTAKAAPARYDLAAGLATAHEAHLTALYVDTKPYVPADIMGTGMAASVLQWQRELRRHRAQEARALIDAAKQRNGIEVEWRVVEGDIDATLMLHGRYHDLIVLSQGVDLSDLTEPLSPSTGHSVVAAGRPVLVLPRENKAKNCGERVLIAWKPTAEAARAVHDALPILKRAKSVTVMEVNPDMSGGQRIAGGDIALHLARHGVQVNVAPVVAPDMDAGSLITARASDLGADLIVMGAYGHSRLREMVLGGTTRHVLDKQEIPVFLSR